MMFGVNSNTRILYTDLSQLAQARIFHNPSRDNDGTAIGRKFDGIDDHVIQSLLEQFRISQKRRNIFYRLIQAKSQVASRKVVHIVLMDQSQNQVQAHRLNMWIRDLVIQPCYIQHTIYDLVQSIRAL